MKHDQTVPDDIKRQLADWQREYTQVFAELPPLADERVKFCAEINRLNRENEELRANQIPGRCGTCMFAWEEKK